MPRVCQRLGCGELILNKKGEPDYSKKRFHSPDCLQADKRERVEAQRQKRAKKTVPKRGRCPDCPTLAAIEKLHPGIIDEVTGKVR